MSSETPGQRALRELVATARERGRKRHARWRPGVFMQLAESNVRDAWGSLAADPRREERVSAWLDLLIEAMGRGLVDEFTVAGPGSDGVLGLLLLDRLPRELGTLDAARMAELWNLGEALAREPKWIDLTLAQVLERRQTTCAEIESVLTATLETLHAPSPDTAPDWKGGDTEVLRIERWAPRFVPGRLRLVRPNVVALRDRESEAELAVSVFADGLTCVTSGASLPDRTTPTSTAAVAFVPGTLRIEDARWRCEGLTAWQHVVVSPAGFAVATCVDSQRLWVARAG